MYIDLALVAFDKGGNPHLFKDLPFEEHNPDKAPAWVPCVFDSKDVFQGPVYLVDGKGKTYIPEPTEIVRFKYYSWNIPQHFTQAGKRLSETRQVRMCLDDDAQLAVVPMLDDVCLSKWEFT